MINSVGRIFHWLMATYEKEELPSSVLRLGMLHSPLVTDLVTRAVFSEQSLTNFFGGGHVHCGWFCGLNEHLSVKSDFQNSRYHIWQVYDNDGNAVVFWHESWGYFYTVTLVVLWLFYMPENRMWYSTENVAWSLLLNMYLMPQEWIFIYHHITL